MCGIVAYIGNRDATEVVLGGLRRLEYRGYDSAGLAVMNGKGIELRRCVGKIRDLEALLRNNPVFGSAALGHTRWATHGCPSVSNAHPHADCTGSVAVVHNGILENYLALKKNLAAAGHRFRSQTDTEIISHLIEDHLVNVGGDLLGAVMASVKKLSGAYAIGVMAAGAPDQIVVAKRGAGGVVVGIGDGETFLASDIPAILPYTREVVVLDDGEVALITREGPRVWTVDGRSVERSPSQVDWSPTLAERGGYRHFMLKEIYEQPQAVSNTIAGGIQTENGAVSLPQLGLSPEMAAHIRHVVLVACGTSYHAALIGRSMIERLAGIHAEADVGSEYRYRDSALGAETLLVGISQSGETADTLGVIKGIADRKVPILAITNVVGSALARHAGGVLYTRAGPEIGVASTKTFTATLTACYLLAMALGRQRGFLSVSECRRLAEQLFEVPRLMEKALELEGVTRNLGEKYASREHFLYLGRGAHYPIALEGALKLKEISYIHAEGYPAGEMKHGPIALIDERMPVVALAPQDGSYDRMLGNIEEVKARGGKVIAICQQGDRDIASRADDVIFVPRTSELLNPLVSVIPLQLLAYHIAVARGCDVDQPRNLAKSVTVE